MDESKRGHTEGEQRKVCNLFRKEKAVLRSTYYYLLLGLLLLTVGLALLIPLFRGKSIPKNAVFVEALCP